MSDDGTQASKIPKQFLCRRCTRCSNTLTDDSLVDCEAAGRAVEPVLRSDYRRFEDCPHRSETNVFLPSCKLKLLAAFARRVRKRGVGDLQVVERIGIAEQVIRQDIQASMHLKSKT